MWHLTKIPKKAYFYWGSHMLSYLRYLTILTFRKHNPDWEIRFYYPKKHWSGSPVWNQGYAEAVRGEDYRDKVKDIENVQCIELDFDELDIGHMPDVFRSDILRLKLLGTEGGLWSDMDIIYFRPMNDICFNLEGYSDVNTVISHNPKGNHYSIGFLMSSENNPFFLHLYEVAMKYKNRDGEYQHLGISLWHNFYNHPQDIAEAYPELVIYNIEMWLTYWINSFAVTRIIDQNVKLEDPRTIALHWYAGHPRCIEWENKITPENINNFNNTLCNTIKRAL